jgi:hypothetical protein
LRVEGTGARSRRDGGLKMKWFHRSKKDAAPPVEGDRELECAPAPRPKETIDLLPVKSGGKWGFIDLAGQSVIPPRFDGARMFTESLARVRKDGKEGFIDRTGALVIEPQFEDTFGGFKEGRALVKIGGLWKFITPAGTAIGSQEFREARPFNEGFAEVKIGEKWGYIERDGRVAIEPVYDQAAAFSEGWAAVRKAGKWSFIDRSGAVVLDTEFEDFISGPQFHEGFALGRIRASYGSWMDFINRKGETVSGGWRLATNFSEGLAAVSTRDVDPIYQYIGTDGRVAFAGQFWGAWAFSDGLAAVKPKDKWGFIDRTGAMALAATYDYVLDMGIEFSIGFYSGLAKVEIGERFAYIDKTGRMISWTVPD